jgi:hypothetical protein
MAVIVVVVSVAPVIVAAIVTVAVVPATVVTVIPAVVPALRFQPSTPALVFFAAATFDLAAAVLYLTPVRAIVSVTIFPEPRSVAAVAVIGMCHGRQRRQYSYSRYRRQNAGQYFDSSHRCNFPSISVYDYRGVSTARRTARYYSGHAL